MKKILLFISLLCFSPVTLADTGMHNVYFGYYTNAITWRPIIISRTHPNDAFIFGMQNRAYILSPHLTLDAGVNFTHASVGSNSLWVIAAYPALRFWLYQDSDIRPFAEYSMGLAWLSQEHFGSADLGGRLSFQNSIGIGINAGTRHVFNFMLKYYHYTNFGIAKPNNGFDIPLVFSIGYEF